MSCHLMLKDNNYNEIKKVINTIILYFIPWCTSLLMCCPIQFARILSGIFVSLFIRDTGL